MPPQHQTQPLLRRSSSEEGVRRLARLEGATHELAISDRLATYYRVNAAGGIEFATASRDDSTWTLSTWLLRVTHGIPTPARPLRIRRPA